MRILATIPELAASANPPSPPPVAQAETGRRSVTPAGGADRRIRREAKPAFPLGSIVALLALAVVAWTLAGWNDARRADRRQADSRQADSQQAGQRLAEQSPSAEEPVIR